jgi:hypothetical protein
MVEEISKVPSSPQKTLDDIISDEHSSSRENSFHENRLVDEDNIFFFLVFFGKEVVVIRVPLIEYIARELSVNFNRVLVEKRAEDSSSDLFVNLGENGFSPSFSVFHFEY